MLCRLTPLIGTLAFPALHTLALPAFWAGKEWTAATTDFPTYFSYGEGGTTTDLVLKVNVDNSPESVLSFKKPNATETHTPGACRLVEKTSMLQLYPNAFEFEEYFFAKGPYIHSPQNYAVFCWNVDLDIGSLPTQGDPLGHSCFWTRSAESIPLTEPDSWLLKCTPHPRQLNMLALPPDNLGNWKAVPARPQACFLYLAGPVDKPYLTIQCIESYNVELHDLPAFKSYLPDSQTTGGHCRLILKSDADDAFPELNLPDTWFTAVNRISRSLDQFGVYCERNDIKYDTRYILPRITPLGHKCYWVLGTGDKSLIFAQCEDAEDWRYQ